MDDFAVFRTNNKQTLYIFITSKEKGIRTQISNYVSLIILKIHTSSKPSSMTYTIVEHIVFAAQETPHPTRELPQLTTQVIGRTKDVQAN